MLRGYRLTDEEDAEDEVALRQFESLGIEQRGVPFKASLQRVSRKRLIISAMAGAAAVAGIALVIILSVQAAAGRTGHHAWECPQGAFPARTPGSITFFAIGDWGRQGVWEQRQVAKMMAQVADCMPPAFIISTGDNFYSHGLTSSEDIQIRKTFTNVYDDEALQVPWYAVLGNHDYGDGIDPEDRHDCAANSVSNCPEDCCYSALWQHTGRLNDARWHLQNGSYAVPTGSRDLLDIFMIDTNPFIKRYSKDAFYNNADGIWLQNPEATKTQLRGYLHDSRAVWKVVVGHHPIASFGSHCKFAMKADCEQMSWLEPELQSAKVAAYLAGHDHDLQHIVKLSDPDDEESDPLQPHYVVSGAGSETRKNEAEEYEPKHGYSKEYMTDDSGFVAVQVNATHLAMYFYRLRHSLPEHTVLLKAPAQSTPPAPEDQPAGAPRLGMAVPSQVSAMKPVQTTPAAALPSAQSSATVTPAQRPAAAAAATTQGAPSTAVPLQPPNQAAAAPAAARGSSVAAAAASGAVSSPATGATSSPQRPAATQASSSNAAGQPAGNRPAAAAAAAQPATPTAQVPPAAAATPSAPMQARPAVTTAPAPTSAPVQPRPAAAAIVTEAASRTSAGAAAAVAVPVHGQQPVQHRASAVHPAVQQAPSAAAAGATAAGAGLPVSSG